MWKNSEFVHLHTHSEYSNFDGLSKLTDLVRKARTMGFPAMALTDHGNIGGLIRFLQECKLEKKKDGSEYGAPPIKPILGVEGYISKSRKSRSKKEQPRGRKGNHHILLLAKNWQGYQNLCTLCNRGWTEGFYHSPRFDLELLAQHREGLIVSTACLSSFVNANLLYDRYDEAKKGCAILKDIMGEDFLLEVMYHGISAEEMIIPDIFRLGRELNIPIFCSNDNHYIEKTHARSQEVLMAMSSQKCIVDPKHTRHPYDEFYYKSASEMAKIFGSHPEVLMNTLAISERIDTDGICKELFGAAMRLPRFEVPEKYVKKGEHDFENSYRYMVELSKEGLKDLKWDKSLPHVQALKRELEDIRVAFESNHFDFATYFLVVWDYVNFAKNNNIIVGAGRGSGYASILLRCLKITSGIDPQKYGLIWERFLGFDDIRFIKPEDFGWRFKEVHETVEDKVLGTEELEEDREVEADMGGVDRY
jgi:DNA polymerase III subunit alpha